MTKQDQILRKIKAISNSICTISTNTVKDDTARLTTSSSDVSISGSTADDLDYVAFSNPSDTITMTVDGADLLPGQTKVYPDLGVSYGPISYDPNGGTLQIQTIKK